MTAARPQLAEIQQFLAQAGVFVDEARRDPTQLLESLVYDNPDAALNAVIEGYKRRGKSMEWIKTRIAGKVNRIKFTAALKAAVAEITQDHYRVATDDIYLGLWQRTAAMLKREMAIPSNKSLRDGQPMLGLSYQSITEEMIAIRLEDRQVLTWREARAIVQMVTQMIGRQAKEASEFVGYDIATGKPLLKG